jgi:xylulokinase
MHGLVGIDQHGEAVRAALIWPDSRTERECAEMIERLTAQRLYHLTGVPATTGMLGPSLMWMRRNEPENFARLRAVLLPKDYVRFRLTGEIATDPSDASGTLLFDVRQRRWSDEILDSVGLDRNLLPTLLASHEIAGRITHQASQMSGLPEGLQVVTGAGDQMAGALAIGLDKPGAIGSVIGSGGQLITSVREPLVDASQRVQTFCHAAPDTWLLMGVVLSAGLSLDWLLDVLAPHNGSDREGAYKELLEQAALVEPGAEGLIFLPLLNGMRTPQVDPHARGCFIGLRPSHARGHLVRAVLEGVAFAMSESLSIFTELGVQAAHVIGSGGGARDPLWRQIQADVYGRPLSIVAESEHSAYGTALLAGVGAGLYRDVAEACRLAPPIVETVVPNTRAAKLYADRNETYRALYPKLQHTFRQLDTAQKAGRTN